LFGNTGSNILRREMAWSSQAMTKKASAIERIIKPRHGDRRVRIHVGTCNSPR